ncbi:MAG: hypothetical protein JOS17DRAFT_764785 [Linnemannia elongata]|nr:MAG: hypothetical protein JOS17DRAFT_764785 [Linnemannia elongata]
MLPRHRLFFLFCFSCLFCVITFISLCKPYTKSQEVIIHDSIDSYPDSIRSLYLVANWLPSLSTLLSSFFSLG